MEQNQIKLLSRLEWVEHLLNTISAYIYVYDVVEQRNIYANRDMGSMLGYTTMELRKMGNTLLETVMHPDDFATLPELFQRIEAAADGEVVETQYRVRGSTSDWVWLQDRITVFSRNEHGNVIEYVGSVQDITAQKNAEAERIKIQEQIIEAQQATLREISSPLIPLTDNIVIMPLIGSIDTQRAQQVMETLLEGVAEHHARIAIIDITGVSVVDTQVANVLIQAAQSVKLLGAQVVLTGIRPSMAQTLVSLRADLRSIVSYDNLQNGIAYALQHR